MADAITAFGALPFPHALLLTLSWAAVLVLLAAGIVYIAKNL